MDDTTPLVEQHPYTVTVSALGRELTLTLPSLKPTLNSAREVVCSASGIEQFDAEGLELLELAFDTLTGYVHWRQWMLAPEDHLPNFRPVLTYGMADPVELVE